MAATVSYGQELPDQFDLIAKVSDAQLALVADIRELVRERAALEKEYAIKLQALVRKATEKKSRRMPSLVLGDSPTKPWDEQTLQRSTLDNVYTQFISAIDGVAVDHIALADALMSQVVEEIKGLESRQGEMTKKQVAFFQQLLGDRDRINAERIKAKQKYYDDCLEFEGQRQKLARVGDDKQADKAARHTEQHRVEMLNSKSSFIISTAIANKIKSGFYADDIPEMQDQLQQIQNHTLTRLFNLCFKTQNLYSACYSSGQTKVGEVKSAIESVNIHKDQQLFIEYNSRPFEPPPDLKFEPCQSYYDKGEFSLEDEPKIFLQNKLRVGREKLMELDVQVESAGRDVAKLKDLVVAYTANTSLGNPEEIFESYLTAQHQYALLVHNQQVHMTEVTIISKVLKGDEGGQKPHSFKSASFSIPTQCGYCKTSIWGLSKQGKTCRTCNLSVHSKCELKVPADCGSASHHKLKQNQPTKSIASPKLVPPAAIPVSSQPSSARSSTIEPPEEFRVLYAFQASSPFELSVDEGTVIHLVEPDDGSGWVKVSNGHGAGLVPASYIEAYTSPNTHNQSSVSLSQGCGVYVKALYDYQSQGPDELTLKAGDTIELSAGAQGGKLYGDGWWEGHDSNGRKGIFPANYVEDL